MKMLEQSRKRPLACFGAPVWCGLVMASVAVPASADWPKPIMAPKAAALPSPIGASSATPGAAPTGAHPAQLPGLIEQMTNGNLSPQRAWSEKLLNGDDLLWIFSDFIGPWGNLGEVKNVPVRRALIELLVKNDDRVQSPEKLPPTVRLWLADYYQSLGDEKCVALSESILSEIKTPVRGENALIFQTVERIAWQHRDKGEKEKTAQTWLRMADYHAESGWWLPDAQIEAARAFRLAGNERRAEELYSQLARTGPDYFASGALKENSQALIREGKTDEARLELEALLKQRGSTTEPKYAAILSVLGYLHSLKGEWPQAAQRYSEAVELGKKLPADQLLLPDIAVLNNAEAMLRVVTQWKTQSMICDPPAINIAAGPEKKDAPITRRFLVSTPQDVLVDVGSSDARIKVLRVEDSPWQSEAQRGAQPLRYEKQVVVEISPDALQKDLSATLTLSSAKLSGYQARVPLRVQMRPFEP